MEDTGTSQHRREGKSEGGLVRLPISLPPKLWTDSGRDVIGAARQRNWRRGHELLIAALNPAPSRPEYATFAKALRQLARTRKTLTEEEINRWFSYESFLQMLGMISINQEDSGGVYALHSHLNHSCQPNLQVCLGHRGSADLKVRNLPKTFAPPSVLPSDLPPSNPRGVRGTNKLTILARHTVPPGEELTISYVNPDMPLKERRETLRADYGFWCRCSRCKDELKRATSA